MKEKTTEIFKILVEAGKVIVDIYKSKDFKTELKSDNSPVTVADKASSKIINSGLKKLFPEIPIIDEENRIPDYNKRKTWSHYFLIDPLDGTKEFISQNGEFSINLALMKDSNPDEGWIYQPLKKQGWYCKRGKGIFGFDDFGNTRRIEQIQKKSDTIRIVASRSFFKPLEARQIKEIKKQYPVQIIHRGSSLKQIDIILGNADLYLKAGPCSEWDTAPGQLMIEEFGGVVLRQNNFETMRYNKPVLLNPHFVMLNSHLNTTGFIDFLKGIIFNVK
ncbi:MAG: 3'(2'),5'-bisphosphate nucleotidase CysQ [Draconibacterium sp.]|nr:3'(2'),5'-bisphosphate nucleotidase CysQ [Draconibacterium sp.]